MNETEPNKRHRRYSKRFFATTMSSLVLVLFYLLLGNRQLTAPPAVLPPGSAVVSRAVDGDTLDIQIDGHKDTVRLIGVDTPETHDPRKQVQCFGQAAAAYTKSLAEGKTVRLEADATNSNRDKYQRLLRYVYLPDGKLLNETLIRQGYGFAYVVFPFTKLETFRQAEAEARTANRGLWAGCGVDDSNAIKQTTGSK